MPDERFAEHLTHPVGRGHEPAGAYSGVAGGAACGDFVHLRITVAGDRVTDAGFEASGCGATTAAASATVELVTGAPLLHAARVNSAAIAAALGGLSAGKLHAADLAADALHRALGAAARADAQLAARADRTLVAMSGGVDSALAALLSAGASVRRSAAAGPGAGPGPSRWSCGATRRTRGSTGAARAPPAATPAPWR